MIIEPTIHGTWIAHGRAGGIPFVAEADTREGAFLAALDAIYVVPPDWRSGEKVGGQCTSGGFQVVQKPAQTPVRPPSPKRLARSSAKRG